MCDKRAEIILDLLDTVNFHPIVIILTAIMFGSFIGVGKNQQVVCGEC